MKNLINSKKGGIPAINEIVMTFLQTTPKPILAVIFILLITTISTFVIPTFLSLYGYTCIERTSGNLELYQIPVDNLVQKNLQDIQRGFFGVLDSGQYALPDDPFPNGDKSRLRIPSECFLQTEINDSTFFGYSALCMDCDASGSGIIGFFTPLETQICVSDGIEARGVLGLENARFCNKCQAPEQYYYNHSNCVGQEQCHFTIVNESLIPFISTEYYKEVDYSRVLDLGGVLRPQDNTQFANIQCSANQKPNLFLFSIELFNRQMWILLLIGSALISFAFAWYNVVLK